MSLALQILLGGYLIIGIAWFCLTGVTPHIVRRLGILAALLVIARPLALLYLAALIAFSLSAVVAGYDLWCQSASGFPATYAIFCVSTVSATILVLFGLRLFLTRRFPRFD